MEQPRIDVTRVLPQEGVLNAAESDAILEIAYLSTVADGVLSDAELDAFGSAYARLTGKSGPPTAAQMDAVLERFAGNVDHAEALERMTELAKTITRPESRAAAYKLAFAMGLTDFATSDEEWAFEDELLGVLGLSTDDADKLEGEVYAALDGEEEG
jgi:hypothetical protein